MPIVRLMENGQVTIPKKFREVLGLRKGDLAEAELDGERIVITPKKPIKDEAWRELLSVMDRVHKMNDCVSEEEVTQDVLKAIAELREEE
ncbi:MAG: AbrB/MazE/SpoVT family DNA-binding domain-containing protein [Candidatus Poribacteria bacterium]